MGKFFYRAGMMEFAGILDPELIIIPSSDASVNEFRLYDLRAGSVPVSSFHDPVDNDSAVYSLAAFGQERFLAGSASSVLKIFDFRNGNKAYYHTNALACSSCTPFPGPSFGYQHMTSSDAFRRMKIVQKSNSLSDLQKCHYDFRTGSTRTCRFHELSKMDLYRPNTNIYLYGTQRNNYGRHVKSPIFSLSSANALCPVVYAGTTGRVYELEISEMTEEGDLLDPYFAADPGSGLLKNVEELTMYETYITQGTAQVPDELWRQHGGPRSVQERRYWSDLRLNERWQTNRPSTPGELI